MDFDPAAASGEQNYKGAPSLVLNEVNLNGDGDVEETEGGKFVRKGGYFRKRIILGKPKDQKPEEQNIGTTVRLVFLKVRRKLVERGDKGKIVRATSEHNSKYDPATLFSDGKPVEDGVAADLREKYPNLRTVQIVYALLLGPNEPELVRLTIRGSSLGSEAKADTTTDFYSYLSSFSGDEHFYQYVTVLTPVLEKGLKQYYAIDFKRGEKLSPEMYQQALQEMKKVHEVCVAQDTARAERIVKGQTVEEEVRLPEDEPTDNDAAYPKDDINPDDIPF